MAQDLTIESNMQLIELIATALRKMNCRQCGFDINVLDEINLQQDVNCTNPGAIKMHINNRELKTLGSGVPSCISTVNFISKRSKIDKL